MAWKLDYLENFKKWLSLENVPTTLKNKLRFTEEDDCSSILRVGYSLKGVALDEKASLEFSKSDDFFNEKDIFGQQVFDLLEKNQIAENDELSVDKISNLDEFLNKDSLRALKERLENSFAAPMQFGTAGLRGKIGPGIACMNVYTIALATAGMAKCLLARYGEEACQTRGVVIGYDTRYHSALFAKTASLVFAAYKVRVNLFANYCATPVLAYSIRPLGALAGIMVTASHNPKAYNGYKVYGEDGIQIGNEVATHISQNITDDYAIISLKEARDKGLLNEVSQIIEKDYIDLCKKSFIPHQTEASLKIAYTPVHGTGAKYVVPLLADCGIKNLVLVKEQLEPNSDFTTAPSPNPEFMPAMSLLKNYAEQEQCDLGIATDPDADRLSIIVPDKEGKYHLLDGNQIGGLLTYFWLDFQKKQQTFKQNSVLAKSIVTNNLGAKIAKHNGVEVRETLTGFKNLCGVAKELIEEGKNANLLIAYEESIGYALNPYVADKDGIFASLILVMALAYYKSQNKDLWDVLEEISHQYGYHSGTTLNRVREGQQGLALMKYTMKEYRKLYPKALKDEPLILIEDFLEQNIINLATDGSTKISSQNKILLPSSDVLRFTFADKSWYALRPSGTEPKLKIYLYTEGKSKEVAEQKLKCLLDTVEPLLNKIEERFYQEL